MITILVLLALLPLALLWDVFRLVRGAARIARNRRAVPLQQRNMARATAGALVLAVCAVLAVHGFPVVGPLPTACVAGIALLYFVVGIHGFRGSRFDMLSIFWWSVLVAVAGGALAFAFVGFPP